MTNYHTHTRWCGHATGEIKEYIEEGIRLGWKEITISDHMPIDYKFKRSMKEDEFYHYNKELDLMKEQYKDVILVRKGMECEYELERDSFYKELKELNYEVLLISQHNSRDYKTDYFHRLSKEEQSTYTKELVEALDTGYFQICAHPDLIANKIEVLDEHTLNCMKEIFKACERNKVYYEINAAAYRKNRGYSNIDILKASKEYKLTYVIGSDAHKPEELYDEAVQYAYKLALELELPLGSLHE